MPIRGANQLPAHTNLVRNLVQFCRLLRQRGVDVTLSEVLDACQAIQTVDLGDREDFYWSLRTILVSRPEDIPVFDELFWTFWTNPMLLEVEEVLGDHGPDQQMVQSEPQTGDEELQLTVDTEQESAETDELEVALYSPLEVLSAKDFSSFQADELEQMERAVRLLAKRLATWRGRRTRATHKHKLVDPRRTARANLKFGGTIVNLAYKQQKIKKPRLVVICDVSRSMDTYSRFLLQFVYALQSHLGRVESFVFSTSLTRVTDYFRGRDIFEALDLVAREVPDWSGGTRIGQSLAAFNRNYARSLVGRRSVVVILSDGLDTGDVELLDQAMNELKQRARRVIWLNPLLGSQEYRPLTRGMRTALPHVDVFAPAHNLASLQELGRHLWISS